MKAEVNIKQGMTKVVLKPENNFEIDILEKLEEDKIRYNIETTVLSDYSYGSRGNYRFELKIIKKAEK